jgi:hypothetical protein
MSRIVVIARMPELLHEQIGQLDRQRKHVDVGQTRNSSASSSGTAAMKSEFATRLGTASTLLFVFSLITLTVRIPECGVRAREADVNRLRVGRRYRRGLRRRGGTGNRVARKLMLLVRCSPQMSGNVWSVAVQLMAFRRELNEFGLELRRVIKCSGINGHDSRRVMRCSEQQAATTSAKIARCRHAAAADLRIRLDLAFE